MGRRIGSLIVKELLAVLSDWRGRIVLIVPPMVQMFIFSFAATLEVKNVPIAIRNKDAGVHGRDLAARIGGSPNFTRVLPLGADAEISAAIDARQVLMVVHIAEDFSRKVAAGERADVQLLLDGRRSNAAQLVAGYATEIIARYDAEIAGDRSPRPVSVVAPRVWFNPNLEPTWSTVPGLVAILMTLMGVNVTAMSVARERELGTFDQLLVSPLSPAEIIVGKTAPSLLIGMTEGTWMVLVAVFAFGVPLRGSILLLALSMVVYLLSVIGIGLFVSSLARTQQQAILGAFVYLSPSILLSGFASPIENMPPWLQWVTLANPARYFMVIVKGLFLKDMPAVDVFHNLWPLLIIAGSTLAAATWFFQRRLE